MERSGKERPTLGPATTREIDFYVKGTEKASRNDILEFDNISRKLGIPSMRVASQGDIAERRTLERLCAWPSSLASVWPPTTLFTPHTTGMSEQVEDRWGRREGREAFEDNGREGEVGLGRNS